MRFHAVTTALLLGLPLAYADQDSLNHSLRDEARTGSLQGIEQWLKRGAEINSQAAYGETALSDAIRSGRFAVALKLIERGADPNVEDESGVTPLFRAAGQVNALRVVEALLRAGADLNHRDLYGRTAFMAAAQEDCERIVASFLIHGRDTLEIDAVTDAGESAYSLSRGGIVRQMIEIGRLYQRSGRSAVEMAEKLGVPLL